MIKIDLEEAVQKDINDLLFISDIYFSNSKKQYAEPGEIFGCFSDMSYFSSLCLSDEETKMKNILKKFKRKDISSEILFTNHFLNETYRIYFKNNLILKDILKLEIDVFFKNDHCEGFIYYSFTITDKKRREFSYLFGTSEENNKFLEFADKYELEIKKCVNKNRL